MSMTRLVALLRSQPPITARCLAKAVGCPLKTAQSDLNRFAKVGLVATAGTQGSTGGRPAYLWALTEAGRAPTALFPRRTKPKAKLPPKPKAPPRPPRPVFETLTIVESAIRAQPELCTVWNPARAASNDCSQAAA